MIRRLEMLALAGLTVAALGALAAQAAVAATFTVPGASAEAKTTVKLLKDGAPKTAHWVFDFEGSFGQMPITCTEVLGDGTVTGGAPTDITIATPAFSACNYAGQEFKVENTGCDFTFTSTGALDIVPSGIHACEPTKEAIEFSNPALGCTLEIGKQELTGVKYHTVEESGKTAITVENNNLKFTYEGRGAFCPVGTKTGTLTTGNAILAGEEKEAMVNLKWDA
jgi:hypothetical protein